MPGDVDTLVATTGPLVGTFAGVPDGTAVTFSFGGCAATFRINYTAHTVTATVPGTPPASSTAVTGPATGVSDVSATLTGTADPGRGPAQAVFEYAPLGVDYTPVLPGQALAGFAGPTAVSVTLAGAYGLAPDTEYHYRLVVFGTGSSAVGADQTFKTTLHCGSAAGSPSITGVSARFGPLRGLLTATASNADGVFIEYGTTTAYDRHASSGAFVPGPFTPGAPYHYRAVAYNAAGTTCSPDQTASGEEGLKLVHSPTLTGPGTATPVPGKQLQCGGGQESPDRHDSAWTYNGHAVTNRYPSQAAGPDDPRLTILWLRDGRQVIPVSGPSYTIRNEDFGHYVSCVQFANNGWDLQPPIADPYSDQSLGVMITNYSKLHYWIDQVVKPGYKIYEQYDAAQTLYDSNSCIIALLVAQEAGAAYCAVEILAGFEMSTWESWLVESVDPPDPHFQAIALPRRVALPVVRTGCPGARLAHCQDVVRALRSVTRASAPVASLYEALIIAGNRFATARTAGDFDAVGAQVAARKTYEGLLVSARKTLNSARDRVRRLLSRLRPVNLRATPSPALPALPRSIAARLVA